jgi:hypothetical protein
MKAPALDIATPAAAAFLTFPIVRSPGEIRGHRCLSLLPSPQRYRWQPYHRASQRSHRRSRAPPPRNPEHVLAGISLYVGPAPATFPSAKPKSYRKVTDPSNAAGQIARHEFVAEPSLGVLFIAAYCGGAREPSLGPSMGNRRYGNFAPGPPRRTSNESATSPFFELGAVTGEPRGGNRTLAYPGIVTLPYLPSRYEIRPARRTGPNLPPSSRLSKMAG